MVIAAVVLAVVVPAVVLAVVALVVLVTDALVVLEGVDRCAQVGLDGRPVFRLARIEARAVLHEPAAGIDVQGDVRGLLTHREGAFALLLGLDPARVWVLKHGETRPW